jgi:hypothetical protein
MYTADQRNTAFILDRNLHRRLFRLILQVEIVES